MRDKITVIGKLLLLSVVNPGFIVAVVATSSEEYRLSLLMAFLMTLLQSIVLYVLVIMHNGQSRMGLLWKATLVFYGTTFLQANIEAVLFLKYMQNTMNNAQIIEMFIAGIVSALVVGPVSVFLFRKEKEKLGLTTVFPLKTNIKRGLALSFIYMMIYIAFGALVFQPLAGEHFQTYYGELQIPPWLFPFQILRGALWTCLAWGTMSIIAGQRSKVIWTITATLAIPITSLLLPFNEIMPAPIRAAHLVELFTSMVAFGLISGWMLTRPLKPDFKT